MKNLLSTLVIGLFVFGLANCSSNDGGGGGAAPAPKDGLVGDADTITINGGNAAGPVEWSSAYSNIYYDIRTLPQGDCVTGLAQSADDPNLDVALEELRALLNAAEIQSGTGDSSTSVSGAPSISVRSGSETTTYYLVDADQVPSDVQVLSNANAIITYYNDVLAELSTNGYYYCPGKGQQLQNQND